MNKYTLISFLVILIISILILNKMVGAGNQLQEKVLGAYLNPMREINEKSGMEIYNLDIKAYSREELQELEEITY